jgi:hypothetical protein
MVASDHRWQKASQRRQVRHVADGAPDRRAPGFVLPPDVIDRLTRDRDPTARFARDLDHAPRVRMRPAIGTGLERRRFQLQARGHWRRRASPPGEYGTRCDPPNREAVVKIRELLRKVDLKLRPLQFGRRPGENVDAMKIDARSAAPGAENVGGFGDSLAPTNWVPSQQDDRPRH